MAKRLVVVPKGRMPEPVTRSAQSCVILSNAYPNCAVAADHL